MDVDSFRFNLSDVTSKFASSPRCIQNVGLFMNYSLNRFHIQSPIGLLAIAIKEKAKKKSLWCRRYVALRTELTTTTPAKNCISQVRTRNTC